MAKQKSKAISNSFELTGKIPPQSVDFEEVVLGALMLEKEAFEKVATILKPEIFYKEAHQRIYKAILNLSEKSEPIDILTITNELKNSGELELVGGPYYITQLTNRIASSANIEYHSRIINQNYIKREIIRICTDTINTTFDDTQDIFESINNLELEINNVINGVLTEKLVSFNDALIDAREQAILREKFFQNGQSVGIKTPLHALTQITAGWQPKQMILIAARPSQGKTSFALACADKAAKLDESVYFSTLETSQLSLTNKIILANSDINANEFRTGYNIELDKIDKVIAKTKDYKIFLDDIPKPINKIKAKAKKLKANGMLDMIIVDYIQLIPEDENQYAKSVREQEVSKNSRALKLLAAELNIPIIVLAQLNRMLEQRPDKKPKLSDLRESGALEQDADVVIMMYNPTYYGLEHDGKGNGYYNANGNPRRFLLIEKQKDGATGSVEYYTNENFTQFYDEITTTENEIF